MTTMLEKMATEMAAELERQIAPQVAEHEAGKWGSAQSHFSGPSSLFGTCQVNGEVDLGSLARAALQAIREPSEDMAKAIYGLSISYEPEFDSDYQTLGTQGASEVFTAMIDAILNEKPEGGA